MYKNHSRDDLNTSADEENSRSSTHKNYLCLINGKKFY